MEQGNSSRKWLLFSQGIFSQAPVQFGKGRLAAWRFGYWCNVCMTQESAKDTTRGFIGQRNSIAYC